MIDYIIHTIPVLFVLIAYFIRLETRLAQITRDISWIKDILNKQQCQQTSIKQ